MATFRLKDKTTTTSFASDDYVYLDGATNGVRKRLASAFMMLTGIFRPTITPVDLGTNLATSTVLTINKNHVGTLSTSQAVTFSAGTPAEGDSIFAKIKVTTAATLTIPSCKRNGAADTAIIALPLRTGHWMFLWQYLSGEWVLTDSVNNSLIHFQTTFDPKAVCDGTFDGLFLATVGDHCPNGLVVTAWKLSCEADPTTELDIDLKRADAFIGRANPAVMDVLDTTTGASSESTPANINSGATVANGKVIYLEFGTAYTEANHQCVFEMWYYPVN